MNAALVMLHWQIGHRVHRDILHEKRAGYGNEIVSTLSRQLSAEFGRGFAEKNLRRMLQFAEEFPDEKIVATLSRELGWCGLVSASGMEGRAGLVSPPFSAQCRKGHLRAERELCKCAAHDEKSPNDALKREMWKAAPRFAIRGA